MNQAINELPVTKEEDEAMDALCRLGAGVPLLNISDGGRVVQYATPSAEVLHKPTPDVTTIINTICEQLSLLATVITSLPNQNQVQVQTETQSLQECVNLTLQQGTWVKHMVEEKVQSLFDDKDFEYYAESAVDSYFNNSFSLDDHVDITAEVENRIEEIVEEQLADVVSEKLSNLRITFD